MSNIRPMIRPPGVFFLAILIIGGAGIELFDNPAAQSNPGDSVHLAKQAEPPPAPPVSTIPFYSYRITGVYPHDPDAFTQGLAYENGLLYESTGLYGKSSIRQVRLETGKILKIRNLPRDQFGEGIALLKGELFQLTWKSRVGYRYHANSFDLIDKFYYPTEGWGLAQDGKRLILSDGSPVIYFYDPDTFTEQSRITVYDDRGPVRHLNELEYIHGEIYANIWLTDRIARIAPHSGQVIGWIDLTEIKNSFPMAQRIDVLNGIAVNPENNRLLITGKLWPKLFEIELTGKK